MAARGSWQITDNYSAGVPVTVHSLQTAAQHNGVDGHLLEWTASTGRWRVKVSTGEELSVRAANLMPKCLHPGCGQRVVATEQAGAGLKKCMKCKKALYCSKGCHVEAWKNGHKRECTGLQEGEAWTLGSAAQEAILEAMKTAQASTELTDRQEEILEMMSTRFDSFKFWDVVRMEKEGLAVAGELQTMPEPQARIYRMLGESFCRMGQHMKGQALLEQARAGVQRLVLSGMELISSNPGLAIFEDDLLRLNQILSRVFLGLAFSHHRQGERKKARKELKQARKIAVEVGDRSVEAVVCYNLGSCYLTLQRYDKAIELMEQSVKIQEELGNMSEQARGLVNLGHCLSQYGQHDRAVSCLKQGWDLYQELGVAKQQERAAKFFDPAGYLQSQVPAFESLVDAFNGFKEPEEEYYLLITATRLGKALWAQARAEHREDAPLTLSMNLSTPNDGTKSLSATGARALQDAETWLRTALGFRKKSMNLQTALGLGINWEITAQMHLACVTFFKGDEDEGVELLSKLLTLLGTVYGRQRCAGCGEVRGQDVPMLVCVECRAVRCVCGATHLPCGVMHRLSSLPWNR